MNQYNHKYNIELTKAETHAMTHNCDAQNQMTLIDNTQYQTLVT